jgi:flagellum-specific ATP synthase
MIEGIGGAKVDAEVVGFAEDRLYLMLAGEHHGLTVNARVIPGQESCEVPVGMGLLGRVLDSAGRPLDRKGVLRPDSFVPLNGRPINPMARRVIDEPLDVGVRAINALLTVGRGQRMGLFAGSGVGKSVLLGMMTRYTDADVTVVGLIGERGREVKEFVEDILGEEGLKRAVVVATPADHPPLMRLHGAMLATSIAEYFRGLGLRVLLLMDSLTRFAQAQREIALAIGEPPATKGYPPSVFAKLPHLVERAGTGEGEGSITAFYTVLVEGDDQLDPIADSARAILDGHVVLSRNLAEAGHFPAIDIDASISRLMHVITEAPQQQAARQLRALLALLNRNQDLINVGAYRPGSNPQLDEAIQCKDEIMAFLKQDMRESISLAHSLQQLTRLMSRKAETA